MSVEQEIAGNLSAVRENIAAAAMRAGSPADLVTLVAISKSQPDERIAAALAAGQLVFGENRVQEAQTHWSERRDTTAGLELHLVGPLQTNKVKEAVALFDVIQTVDRPKLAEHLARAFDGLGKARRCFVQVNTGEEAQKAGVSPAEADGFIAACRGLELPVEGLMCIPPADAPVAPHFALLRKIAERNGLAALSMGMSADYAVAAELGATYVRVGRGIFGERAPRV
ncbi:MAG: YggS family pyridoxal phosphate-dependent enzyme [Alphaproteobacteria bacterium]|jgi:PLP dependent protein|nr:YggS family pyridoxal phosphate-dependent enzyme [Alphaproteobacteria bacterium]